MSPRTRAGLALIGLCLALAAGLLAYLDTLQATPGPPADGADPERWWRCHAETINDLPAQAPCLTETP